MHGRTASFADRFLAMLTAVLALSALPASAQTAAPAPPPPASKQAPAQSAPPTQGATPATVLDDKDVESILGREIYSPTGEDMGKIVDVLVDHAGQVRAAIIDFGGFLGVGTRKIAVDWQAIRFAEGNSDHIVLSLTRDEVRVAPEYKQGEPIVVLGPSAKPSAPPANASAAPPKAAPSK
ncbi:MAG: PRC-barrel domain-containing protein [Methylovirgula sp.]|jgi:sporulation protein YlmC with PRC-barrel domain